MKKKTVFVFVAFLMAAFIVTGCGLGKGEGKEPVLPQGGSRNFAGTYNIEGPDYEGTLTIKKAGEGYVLEWSFPNGQTHYGSGIEMEGVLGVVYAAQDGAGVAAYKMKGSKITGIWTPAGGEELAFEKSKGVDELRPSTRSIAGVYDAKGEYVNGEEYENTLTLERSGETFQAYWEWDDGSSFPGTGFVVDNIAIVGFGDEEGAGITVYKIRGSTLDGKWVFTAYEDFEDLDKINLSPEKAVKQ